MTNEQVSPLAASRLAARFTQEGLAEQLGIDRSTIGRWESGVQSPQPWQRPDLATSLRISLTELDDVMRRTRAPTETKPIAAAALNDTVAADLQRGQQEWLYVRNGPGVRGCELTAWLFPESQRAGVAMVPASHGWVLDARLDSVRLVWGVDDQDGPSGHSSRHEPRVGFGSGITAL